MVFFVFQGKRTAIVVNNIYGYFQEKGLTHMFYCDGVPVIQIDLPRRMIYKLMRRGVI